MACAVVTSSPYKLALEEAEKKRNEKFNEKEDSGKRNEKLNEEEDSRKRKITRKSKINKKSNKTAKKKLAFENESDEDGNCDDFDSGESVLEHVVGVLKPNDEDAVCIFCEGQYSNDSRGERWVQCLACEMWAHDECAGCEKDAYICDFCQ